MPIRCSCWSGTARAAATGPASRRCPGSEDDAEIAVDVADLFARAAVIVRQATQARAADRVVVLELRRQDVRSERTLAGVGVVAPGARRRALVHAVAGGGVEDTSGADPLLVGAEQTVGVGRAG